MREAPEHVIRALRAEDPALEVRWSSESGMWQLRHRGRTVCALRHGDGTPMLSLDGYTDEIVALVQRSDNRRDGPERLRRFMRGERERQAAGEQQRKIAEEATRREAEKVGRVWENGPRPFLPPMESKSKPRAAELPAATGVR